MYRLIKIFSIILFFIISEFHAQNVVQLFVEDFNSTTFSWSLNDTSFGINSGNNKWVINSNYNGNGLTPNTLPQTSTYGGTQLVMRLLVVMHTYTTL